jgi:hypothetical protein
MTHGYLAGYMYKRALTDKQRTFNAERKAAILRVLLGGSTLERGPQGLRVGDKQEGLMLPAVGLGAGVGASLGASVGAAGKKKEGDPRALRALRYALYGGVGGGALAGAGLSAAVAKSFPKAYEDKQAEYDPSTGLRPITVNDLAAIHARRMLPGVKTGMAVGGSTGATIGALSAKDDLAKALRRALIGGGIGALAGGGIPFAHGMSKAIDHGRELGLDKHDSVPA